MKLSPGLAKKLLVACRQQTVMIMGVTYLSGSFPHMPLSAQPHPRSESQNWRAVVCPHNVWSYRLEQRRVQMPLCSLSDPCSIISLKSSSTDALYLVRWSASAMMRARKGLQQGPYCESLSVSDRTKAKAKKTHTHTQLDYN